MSRDSAARMRHGHVHRQRAVSLGAKRHNFVQPSANISSDDATQMLAPPHVGQAKVPHACTPVALSSVPNIGRALPRQHVDHRLGGLDAVTYRSCMSTQSTSGGHALGACGSRRACSIGAGMPATSSSGRRFAPMTAPQLPRRHGDRKHQAAEVQVKTQARMHPRGAAWRARPRDQELAQPDEAAQEAVVQVRAPGDVDRAARHPSYPRFLSPTGYIGVSPGHRLRAKRRQRRGVGASASKHRPQGGAPRHEDRPHGQCAPRRA